MMQLPMPIVPMAEVSLIDENVVAMGHPLDQLMDQAGKLVAQEAAQLCPSGTILLLAVPAIMAAMATPPLAT